MPSSIPEPLLLKHQGPLTGNYDLVQLPYFIEETGTQRGQWTCAKPCIQLTGESKELSCLDIQASIFLTYWWRGPIHIPAGLWGSVPVTGVKLSRLTFCAS